MRGELCGEIFAHLAETSERDFVAELAKFAENGAGESDASPLRPAVMDLAMQILIKGSERAGDKGRIRLRRS